MGIGAMVMAAIAMVGTVVNAILGYRTQMGKLQYDSRIQELEIGQERCLEDHKECKEETTQIKSELKACREEHHAAALDREQMRLMIEEIKCDVKK